MKFVISILLFMILLSINGFSQMGNHHGHLNPDSLQNITISGITIIDTTSMLHALYYLDSNNDNEPDYFLNFGPYWYEPDSSSALRPSNGDQVTIKGGLWEINMMDDPMIVVYEINGEFWRDPFDPSWNHMGYRANNSNSCNGNGFGWMHDTLTTVTLSGIAIVDTTFIHNLYYLDENNDGQPDYFLNFGPWWYEPASGAVRPKDGDNITIIGGKLNRENLPMLIVYEINNLFWRDSLSLHLGGGWIHRNMNQPHHFNSPFDRDDIMTINPGWYQMGGGHGGHGGMMTDSMFCQIFETVPEGLSNSSNQNICASYEINIYQNNGMNGNHHNGDCGGHMHFNSNASFQLHYNDEQISGFNESSISAKYWDNQSSSWLSYPDILINTSDNTISFSTSDLSNFIILTAEDAVGIKDEEISITDYRLGQNYPNPFNPVTNFEFQIANTGLVSLKVFDILGNEVVTLVNEEKPAGTYTVNFSATRGDGSGLASGIYLYQIRAGDYIVTKKMLFLK